MRAKIENNYGSIIISHNVIATIAGDAAMRCYGVIGMAAKNTADGIVSLLKKNNLAKGIKIEVKSDGIYIDIFVMLMYGVSIPAASDSIIESIRYQVEKATGFNVCEVNVNIESVKVD